MNDHGYEHLQAILERLKLTRVPERLDQLAEEAAKESWTYVEFLDRVLDIDLWLMGKTFCYWVRRELKKRIWRSALG